MRIKLFSLSLLAASVLLMSTPLLAQELEPALQQEETQSAPAEETAAEVQVTQEGETSLEPSGEPAESAPTSIEESRELPQTASPLALMALLGAAGVGSASIVRVIRRR